MIDPAVLLTPVLVLAVLLLLGFAGCFTKPPPPGPRLCVRVRVPTALAVTGIDVRSVPPVGKAIIDMVTDPTPESTEGGDNVFRLYDGPLQDGTWMVTCRVTVVQDGATLAGAGDGTFMLDGTNEAPCANFQASVSGGTLDVVHQGLT